MATAVSKGGSIGTAAHMPSTFILTANDQEEHVVRYCVPTAEVQRNTDLQWSCRNGHLARIKELCANIPTDELNNIVHEEFCAYSTKPVSCVKLLIKNEHIQVLSYLVRDKGVRLRFTGSMHAQGHYVTICAERGRLDMLRFLLEEANMTDITKEVLQYALDYSVGHGHFDIAKLLIEHNAPLSTRAAQAIIQSSELRDAIFALYNGRHDTTAVQMLIDNGYPSMSLPKRLENACRYGDLETIQALCGSMSTDALNRLLHERTEPEGESYIGSYIGLLFRIRQLEVLQYLTREKGVDLKCEVGGDDYYSVTYFAARGQILWVKLALSNIKQELLTPDALAEPLTQSVVHGHLNVALLLIGDYRATLSTEAAQAIMARHSLKDECFNYFVSAKNFEAIQMLRNKGYEISDDALARRIAAALPPSNYFV